jgi:TPR repeat protein
MIENFKFEIANLNFQITQLNKSFDWFPHAVSKYFDFFSNSRSTKKKRSSLIIGSFEHFKLLADYGDIDSTILVGLLLLLGIGHKPDLQLSQKYFQIAAVKRNPIGLIISSLLLLNKIDDNNSLEKIYTNLQKCVELNDLNGFLIFERVCYNGFLKVPSLETFVGYADHAAMYGSSLGQNWFGCCLQIGEDIVQCLPKAVKYFKLSSDHGCLAGMVNYASCLEKGEGISQNVTEVMDIYKNLANLQNAKKIFQYVRCLRNGIGYEKNMSESNKYLALAESFQ